MNLQEFKAKLKTYSEKDIIFTKHAQIRLIIRDIDLKEVVKNIINPEKLMFFEEQTTESNFKKYNCYFSYSGNLTYRYVFTINGKILIVTAIKINRDYQKIIKKK
jgi:hypothetical protein